MISTSILDNAYATTSVNNWERYLEAAVLTMFRLSGLCTFAPLLSSAAIAPRIKVSFVLAMTGVLAPVAAAMPNANVHLSAPTILNELGVGLLFCLCLSLLTEAIGFAGTLLNMEFSFSLVNLIDPNSMIETPVLGQLLNWLTLLVLIGTGLDRCLIAALVKSMITVPIGHAILSGRSCAAVAMMAGCIFLAGLQLAAPVVTAATVVELTIGLLGKISPSVPATVITVPLKSVISYTVLLACLAVWPHWIEGRFMMLLDVSQRLVAGS